MTRKELFKAVQELRDTVRFDTRYIGKSFEPEWSALCGKLERFENSLCATTPKQTIKDDFVKLTLLRLQARKLNLYSFKHNPNESWIQKYQLWCDDTSTQAG
jgi:hypothetical protein